MKIMFIPLIKKEKFNKEKINQLNKLPDIIDIVYIIQYKKLAEQIRDYLKKTGKKIVGFSQVLGCSELKTKETILLIGDGNFHAYNLLEQGNQVYLFDNHNLQKLNKEENNNKGKINKLYSADKIGILISTKPGQYNITEINKIKSKDFLGSKKIYLFLADNINTAEFENFDIDFWINTACPGLSKDSFNILNSKKI